MTWKWNDDVNLLFFMLHYMHQGSKYAWNEILRDCSRSNEN